MAIRGRFSDCLIQKIEPISELSPDLYINFNNYKMALGWNGVNLVQLAEDGSNSQKFVLTPRATSAVPEGIYFFKNPDLGHYMQIDDDESVTTEGAKFELWGFDGDNDQKWEIDYTADGCYRILSVASGKAVTAPPSGNDENITQTVYTGGDNQWWIITVTDNGMYNLSPKSNPSYRMAASFGAFTPDGRNVELRDPRTDNKDEWNLCWNCQEMCSRKIP